MRRSAHSIRLVLPYLLAAVFVIAAVVWVMHNWQQIRSLCTLKPTYLAGLLPLVLLSMLLTGLITQVLAGHFGVRLRFVQWSSLGIASALANYVLPMRAGAVVRAAYLKKRHDFPVSKFASAMVLTSVAAILANSLMGLCMLAYLKARTGRCSWPFVWLFAVLAAASLLVLKLAPRSSNASDRVGWMGFVIQVHQGWTELCRSPSLIVKIIALTVASTVLQASCMYLAFAGLGQSVSWAGCLLIGATVAVSMFVTMTPASLGIREAAVVLSSWAIGVGPELSLLAGAVDRAANIVLVAALGPISMTYVSHDVAAASARNDKAGP